MSFAKALEHLGIAYRFIAPEQIDQLPKFKALILPESSALSEKTVIAIRNFASRGGIVIADYDPASLDEKCVKRSKPALDTLFGVRRSLRTSLRSVEKHNIPNVKIKQAIRGMRLAGGKALYQAGDYPLVIVKGKCALLNFVPEYEQNMDKGFLTLLKKLLVGVEPIVKVDSTRPMMQHFYKQGDNLYITLLPEPLENSKTKNFATMKAASFKAKVTLPKKSHIYDTRNSKYLGFIDSFTATFIPGEGAMYTVMPNKLDSINVTGPTKAKLGSVVKVDVAANKSNNHHVYALRVLDPLNKDIMEYRKVLNVTNKAQFTIPFALNDKVGTYTVVVTEAATGLQGKLKINVTEK
jgi:hypothetical protein